MLITNLEEDQFSAGVYGAGPSVVADVGAYCSVWAGAGGNHPKAAARQLAQEMIPLNSSLLAHRLHVDFSD
jgi:hypothetical protein